MHKIGQEINPTPKRVNYVNNDDKDRPHDYKDENDQVGDFDADVEKLKK